MATEAERMFAAVSRVRNLLFRHAGVPVRAAGLTVTQFEVLEAISARGPLSVGEVAEAIFGTPGNVPVVIGNLERAGLVERRRSPDDGRVSIVGLTPEGARRVEGVYPQVVASIERDLAALSPEEVREVRRLLRKVTDAAEVAEGGRA